MNSCHSCTTIPKCDQIISCDNCQNSYCLKCIKTHLNEPSIQKTFIICNFDTIRFKKQSKSWLCFSCQKLCLCRACKGTSLGSIERQLLGRKETPVVKRKIEDFQQHFQQIQLFKNMNFAQLSPFEQEYFMNKAMLYCRQNEHQASAKKPFDQSSLKPVPQKAPINQNVIQIDSDENAQAENRIEEQANQQEIQEKRDAQVNQEKNQAVESMAAEVDNKVDNTELKKNSEAIQVQGNDAVKDKIVEEPNENMPAESGNVQVQVPEAGQKVSQN